MARRKGMPVDPDAPATGNFAPPEKAKRGRTPKAPPPPSLPITQTLDAEILGVAKALGQEPAVVRAAIAPTAEGAVRGQVGDLFLSLLKDRLPPRERAEG